MHSGSANAVQVYIAQGLQAKGFCTSSAFASAQGRQRIELAGPNKTTNGALTAAAICAGPLSFPTNNLLAAQVMSLQICLRWVRRQLQLA